MDLYQVSAGDNVAGYGHGDGPQNAEFALMIRESWEGNWGHWQTHMHAMQCPSNK